MQGNSGKRESVQQIILALLVSQKHDVSLTELDRDYRKEEGEQIPWKEFGYISLYDYLQSMPNCVYLKTINGIHYASGIASDKSKHVSSLVARQKGGPGKPTSIRKTFKPSHYFPDTAPPNFHIPADVLSYMISIVKECPYGIDKQYIIRKLRTKCPSLRIEMNDLNKQLKELSHELYVEDKLIFPKESKINFTSDTCKVNKISAILSKPEERINFEYTDKTSKYCVSGDSDSEINVDNNDMTFDETSIIDGIYENGITNKKQPISKFIQETVYKCNQFNGTSVYDIEGTEHNNLENNWIHTLAEKKCEEDVTYLNEENAKLLISDRTKFRLEKLMQKYPNGIWCAELPVKYLEEYNISLNYIELGFNSVREFASCLPEIFCCKQLQPSGDYILYDVKHELKDTTKKERIKLQNICETYSESLQEDNELEALPIIISTDTSNKLIPEGVMTMGETVGYISVINLENGIQPYIEVFVEEVFTPSLFWVQLRKKRKLFNKLMEELHAFYEEKCMLYKIPPVVLEKGLNCACIYNDQWHRGIIKAVKPNLKVTVMFYDYGTLKTYPPDAIYYLHRSFSYLPAQAIPCGLYNIRPHISRHWSEGVTYEFALRTHQKPLIATIASTDPENNSMLVTLTDTMEEEDVHINDLLVHQNLAVHGTLVCMSRENFLYHHYLKCIQNHKTNSKDLSDFKPDITQIDRNLILSKDLTENSVSQHLHVSSNHVLSTSVNSNTENNFSSNDSKKDTKFLQKVENNFITNAYFKAPTELINLFKSAVNIYRSKLNDETKVDTSRYSNSVHEYESKIELENEKNFNSASSYESKIELENEKNFNSASSSVECDDSVSNISENNRVENNLIKKDINVRTRQKKQKRKNVPLPKECFTNAVNLSTDSESHYLDSSTLPDDNINLKNNNLKLMLKRKHKINFTNIKIGVPEIFLLQLRSNASYKNTLENVTKSSDEVKSVKTDSQLSISCDNKTVTLDDQKDSNITEINEKKNYELNNELIIKNAIDFNDNSKYIYHNTFVNLQNITDRFNICNTSMNISNTHTDDSKLDSDDLPNGVVDCNTSANKTDIQSLSDASITHTNSSSEKMLNLVYNTNNKENNLVIANYQPPSFLKSESKCLEQVGLSESILEDVEETKDMKIKTFNDIDIESDKSDWDIEGDIQSFFS